MDEIKIPNILEVADQINRLSADLEDLEGTISGLRSTLSDLSDRFNRSVTALHKWMKEGQDFKACPVCKKIFAPKRRDTIYCGENCRTNAYHRRKREGRERC